MRKWCVALLMFLLLVVAEPAQAAGKMAVTLPDFTITINDVVVDNQNRQYPFLLYQGITYFPLTYDDSRFLGVETSWTEEEGLVLERTDVSCIYRENTGGKNSGAAWAEAVDFPVRINGERIDGGGKYPFFTYRGVTYLPLTWHYTAELLGWTQQFEAQEGLSLSSSNPQMHKIAVRSSIASSFMVMEDYLLLQDGRELVSISLANPQERTVLWRVPLLDDGNYQLGEFNQVGEAYYFEVAPTGRPGNIWQRYRVVSPFELEQVDTKQNIFIYGQKTIMIEDVDYGVTGNLYIQENGGEKRALGDPKYCYRALEQYSVNGSFRTAGVHFADEATIVLLANDPAAEYGGDILCKVDLKSGAATLLKEGIGQMTIDGQTAYYREHYTTDACGLYQLSLVTGDSQRVELPQPYAKYRGAFAALNGQLYYQDNAWERPPLSVGGGTPETQQAYEYWEQTLGGTSGLYRFGETKQLNPDAEVLELRVENGYVYALFSYYDETPAQPYRLMVFDAAGQVVFQTTDAVLYGVIQEDYLVYTLDTDKGEECAVYWVKLKSSDGGVQRIH